MKNMDVKNTEASQPGTGNGTNRPTRKELLQQQAQEGKADAAFVVHAPSRVDPGQPLAGLMVDEWTEIIPAGKETTGLTFHYDAPAARPPQTILLAVPPDLSEPNWSFDALRDTLLETLELAQFRLAAPQHIDLHGSILPMVYLPQNFTRDVPSVDFFKLVAKAQVHLTGTFNVLGKV